MQGTTQNYTLDMADGTAPKPLIVKQGDTNSREARISLTAFKEPWTIPFGCQIHINVRKNDKTYANATCTQEDEHTVLAPITEQMTTVPGTQLGELFFLGTDGDIRSQTFPLVVWDAVTDLDLMQSSNDFQALKDALRDVKISTDAAGIATQYATEQGNAAGMAAQRAEDAADSIQVAVDAAEAAKASETNAKTSETAAAQTQQEVTDYIEAQKAAFVGYSKRESDSKYANAITATAEGEGGVTVEDAWTAPVLDMEVAGRSEQVTTTGKNLFGGVALVEKLKTEADATVDGTNRTVMFRADRIDKKVIYSSFEPGKEYTVILYGKNTNTEYSGVNLIIEYTDGTNEILTFSKIGAVSYCVYHTVAQKDVANITGRWGSQETILYYDECGVFEGNISIEAYEPYTGGVPSPCPDYPQDIISVGTVSTGAQLFYKSLATLQGRGAEVDIIDKRAIKITYGGKYAGFIVDDKINIIGKTLTVSYSGIVSSKSGLTPGIRLYWIDNNGSVLSNVVYVNKSPTTITIKDPQNDAATKLALLLYADVGDVAVVNDYVIYKDIMINAGNTALPWEPYTGGKPAPSVEYPQTLEVGVTGAQLFDASTIQAITKNGVTFTNNGDGSITVRGTATAQTSTNFVEVNLEPGQYRISGGNAEIKIIARVQDGETINYYSNNKFDVTISSNINIYMQIDSGKTVNSTVWPMLNAGDQPLPWEPYKGHQTATITLTEPLRGIGEYRDRIMRRDGVWGIERWCQADIFDGSADEAWIMYSQEIRDRYYIIIKNAVHTETSSVLCDKAVGKQSGKGNAYTELNTIWLQSTPEYRRLYLNFAADDVEKLREELQMNPLTVIYPLESPTWEPFDDATQQALNALTTYSGTTHLTITAGGTAPTVTLDYVKDTHKALEQCQEAAKEYTDNQIAAIVAALPTATQAAIVDTQTSTLLKEVERL